MGPAVPGRPLRPEAEDVMKINPSSIDALLSGKDAKVSGEAGGAKAAPVSPKSGADRVELSPLSAQIAALESSLAAEPVFDRARVDAIKQAIADGRLNVNAGVVADRMIASALAMFDRSAK
jgi:negative regulator of flagellin synthesis FlgM